MSGSTIRQHDIKTNSLFIFSLMIWGISELMNKQVACKEDRVTEELRQERKTKIDGFMLNKPKHHTLKQANVII